MDGRDAFKPADKVKKMILGSPGTSCEILMKRWTCDGEESIIYSTSLIRTKLVADELDGKAEMSASLAHPLLAHISLSQGNRPAIVKKTTPAKQPQYLLLLHQSRPPGRATFGAKAIRQYLPQVCRP